eukprot:jgi/Botrbrau1/9259/Bobra.180_1s0016.1
MAPVGCNVLERCIVYSKQCNSAMHSVHWDVQSPVGYLVSTGMYSLDWDVQSPLVCAVSTGMYSLQWGVQSPLVCTVSSGMYSLSFFVSRIYVYSCVYVYMHPYIVTYMYISRYICIACGKAGSTCYQRLLVVFNSPVENWQACYNLCTPARYIYY